ncbi:MAG: hypothetical protein AAB678_01800, partial [Patescibacteria group bacterium]
FARPPVPAFGGAPARHLPAGLSFWSGVFFCASTAGAPPCFYHNLYKCQPTLLKYLFFKNEMACTPFFRHLFPHKSTFGGNSIML